MSSELQIRTPEGIIFSYPLAGPITRCVAWSVDLVVVAVLSQALSTLSLLAGLFSADFAVALSTLSYFVVSVSYGVVMEWAWRGQTIGKRLLRLRVLDASGLRLQFHQVLMRNLLRPVDMLPAFYLVGGLACLSSQRAQRLGDLAANTIVVHQPVLAEPDLDQLFAGKFNSLRQHPHLAARLRQRVSPQEARLALQAIVRRDELESASRVRLFEQLASHFRAVVPFPPEAVEAMPDEQYVRNVVDCLFRAANAPERPLATGGVTD